MRIIIVSLFFILIIISQMNTIVDIDLWWILKTGEFITTNLNVPRIDIFSYTLGNNEWVNHEWFSQVIFYTVFQRFGWAGINMLKALVVSLCFFILLFLVFSRYKKMVFYLFIALFSILAFGYRSFARPEIFSYLLLCIYFYSLEKRKGLFILPVLQILWVNLHGYFILGPLLIFLYSVGEWLSGEKDKAKRLAIVFMWTAFACFISPYFYKGAFYPFRILLDVFTEQKLWIRNMTEVMMPVNSDFGAYAFLWVFTFLSSATFVLNIKKAKISHVLVYAFLFAASYFAIRNIPMFIFLGVPLASINFNEARLTKERQEKMFYFPFAIAICCVIYFFASDGYYKFTGQFPMRKTGIEVSKLLTPSGACNFLKKNHIEGRIFNTVDFGPYIAYEFYPEKRIFIDSRSDLYRDDFYKIYSMVEDNPVALEKVRGAYNFDISLIRHLFKDTVKLLRYLHENPEWAMVYYDENSAVFIKDNYKNKEILQKYRIDFNRKKIMDSDVNINIAAFFQKIGELRLAEEIYLKLLEVNPKFLDAGNNLAAIYIDTGRLEKGVKLINKFLNCYPESAGLYANMSVAYLRMEIRNGDNGYKKDDILPEK